MSKYKQHLPLAIRATLLVAGMALGFIYRHLVDVLVTTYLSGIPTVPVYLFFFALGLAVMIAAALTIHNWLTKEGL